MSIICAIINLALFEFSRGSLDGSKIRSTERPLVNHSPIPQVRTPPPIPVGPNPRAGKTHGFPWGFASMLILLSAEVIFYFVAILPIFIDCYMQTNRTIPFFQSILWENRAIFYLPSGYVVYIWVLTVLILAYQRWVMPTRWRKWVLLVTGCLILGVIFFGGAVFFECMHLIAQARNNAGVR